MKSIENECVSCDLPCIYESCPYYAVERYYCDECGQEDTLYQTDWGDLCAECLLNKFTKIN